MDKYIEAIINLGIGGAALLVFGYLMLKMMDNHKEEREKSQERTETHMKEVVKEFREEMKTQRDYFADKVVRIIKESNN